MEIENLKLQLESLSAEVKKNHREILALIQEKNKINYTKREQLINDIIEIVNLGMKTIYITHRRKYKKFIFPQDLNNEKKLFKNFSKSELEDIFNIVCEILEKRGFEIKLKIKENVSLSVSDY